MLHVNRERALADQLSQALAKEYRGGRDPIVDRLKPISGDADLELWRLRYRWREDDGNHAADLAARVPLSGAGAAEARREAEALTAAAEAGIRVPGLWATEPWPIVDWVEGETFGGRWRRRDTRAEPDLLAEVLLDLHEQTERRAPAPDPLAGLRLPDWLRPAAARLAAKRPSRASASLVHGRFGPDRVVMPPKGGPVLVGWTEGGIGDPRVDVGWASLILSEAYGGALRTPFLRAYRAGRSIAPEDLGWFEALAAVRRIAELASAGGGSREAQEHALAWLRQELHGVDITPSGEGSGT